MARCQHKINTFLTHESLDDFIVMARCQHKINTLLSHESLGDFIVMARCQHKINTLLTHEVQDKSTYQLINLSTHQLKKHQLINSKNTSTSTQKTPARLLRKSEHLQLTNLKTHQLENLNCYLLFYNIVPKFALF